MNRTVRIGGQLYRLIGTCRLSALSRASYGKYRFTVQRVSDGSLWEAFGVRLTPGSELVRRRDEAGTRWRVHT